MHHKNIKRVVKKQLKKDHPHWKRLTKKEKKELAKQVTLAVINDYDFEQEIDAPVEELIGVETQMPSEDIISLDQMNQLVNDFYHNAMIDVTKHKTCRVNIKDSQLKFIDNMLDDPIIDRLLSYKGFTPSMRKLFLSNLLRAELLKAIKYPEISYRKYCTDEYMGLDRKENREFIGLPLHKKQMIDHTQLSQFRSSLTFTQNVNLLVYILSHFFRSGILSGQILHGVDSTELFNDTARPLFTTTIKGKKIRVYQDLDCDCGKRRNKRNKNTYFIGYRLHTLTVIDARTGHSFPLVSLVAPGNHHDSLFLKPLTLLAQTMGVEVKLITADEAYHDKDGSFFEETGVTLVTPPSTDTKLPENVDPQTYAVTQDDWCDIPMCHLGCTAEGHEYKCNAAPDECPLSINCSGSRIIPFDEGVFQRILMDGDSQAKESIDIRKNCERPFNLLKHREGLEEIRVRSQHALISKCTITTMATLLLEMESRLNDRTKNNPQLTIFPIAA